MNLVKPISDQTLYEILEIPPDASTSTIVAAVERARSLYGPGSIATYSLVPSEESELLSRRIDEAEVTLLDADARARYDEELVIGASRRAGTRRGSRTAPVVIPAMRVVTAPPSAGEPAPPAGEPEAHAGAAGAHEDLPPVPAGRTGEAATEEPKPLAPAPRPPDVREPTAVPPVAAAPEATPPPPAAAVAPAPPAPAPEPPSRPRQPILLDREVKGPVLTPLPVASVPSPGAPLPLVPPPVSDATAWTGEVLRRLREARGITLVQLSDRIKVTRHHIENIEGDRFDLLPAPVYLRGILLSIARELRLDGQKVARSYLERITAPPGGGPRSG